MTKHTKKPALVPVQVRLRKAIAEEIDQLAERLRAERPGLKYSRTALCELFVEVGILSYKTSGELPTVASALPELDVPSPTKPK